MLLQKLQIISDNRIPRYDATKKNDTEQTFTEQWPYGVNLLFQLFYCKYFYYDSNVFSSWEAKSF